MQFFAQLQQRAQERQCVRKHYLVQKVIRPLSKRAQRLGSKANLSLGRNTGVWVKSSYVRLWRHIGSRRVRVMKKLDEFKVKWIILQKQKGETASSIAKTMNVSTRRVKKIWARYRYMNSDRILYPAPMGRSEDGIPGRREHSAVLTARRRTVLVQYTCTESSGIVPE